MIHYLFPSVKSNLKLERRCPHCHRLGGNKHSRIRYRAVSDIKVHAIAQQRMKSQDFAPVSISYSHTA